MPASPSLIDTLRAVKFPPTRLDHPKIGLPDVLTGSEQIAQRLRTLSASVGPSTQSQQFYTRIRVKGLDSIREKVDRHQRGERYADPDYSFRQLTDFVGFRIVTLYDSDLPSAVDYVVNLLLAGQTLREPLFEPGLVLKSFYGAKFITRTKDDKKDIYFRCAKQFEERIEKLCKEARKAKSAKLYQRLSEFEHRDDSEYSSAHIIFHAISYHQDFSIMIPVEFQLRTAVEDLWSEINHKLLYKIRNPYAWSSGYEEARLAAGDISKKLKEDLINELPDKVLEFSNSSEAATNNIDRIWDEAESATFQDAPFHFSLCLTLIYCIGSEHRSPTGSLVANYHANWVKFRKTKDTDKCAKLLHDSIALLQAAIKRVELVRQGLSQRNYPNTNGFEADKELLDQRILLYELEILRLRTLISLFYDHEVKGGRLLSLKRKFPEAERKYREDVHIGLYGEFCKFRDRSDLKVRPLTMIYYWKHLLSQSFNIELAKNNIYAAYNEIHVDRAIPPWSIYTILVRRFLASHLFSEASITLDRIAEANADYKVMGGLRKDVKTKLFDALTFAIDAFRIHVDKKHEGRRGDIRFGFEGDDKFKDAELIADICDYFNSKFTKEFITDGKETQTRNLIEAINLFLKQNRRSARTKLELIRRLQTIKTLAERVLRKGKRERGTP